MKLFNQIKEDAKQAMRAKEKEKLSTLRLLTAELEKEMKLTGVNELTDEQVQTVISRQIKKLDKEIESYVAVNRATEKQEAEKEVLFSYLPKQLTEAEIHNEILVALALVKSGDIKNPMQYLSKLKGKADMGLVSRIVKEFKN